MSSDKFRRLYIYFVTYITLLSKKMNQDAFIKISHLNGAFLWTKHPKMTTIKAKFGLGS